MFARVAIFVGLILLVVAEEQQLQVASVASYSPGIVRSFTVAAEPNFSTPYGLAILGSAARFGAITGAFGAELDALGFAFRNPMDPNHPNDRKLGFYLGAFVGAAYWNLNTSTATAAAAFAELAATYSTVAAYWERDGKPGFTWSLGQPLYCSGRPTGNTDCIESSSTRNLDGNSVWNPISVTNASCPTGYTNRCRIYSFTTSTTNGLFTISFKLASEPVLVGGVRIEPHYGKIDITINYPWSSLTVANANELRLMLIASYAGKAGLFGARAASVDGARAYVFTGGLVSSYFSWDGVAQVGGVSKSVYALGISGTTIKNYNCQGCDIISQIVLGIWQAAVRVWEAFGWSVEFVAFSWADAQTATVVWDPVMGITTANSDVNFDAASPLAPSLLVAIVAAIFAAVF